ncbi:class I SAM-dependent methyltransferase [Methanolobus bombayensis]|uniref:class I SAM-dependent methyltransferase n=1 Tax=Methanolobus bombayensis TaxID=38023 RepID=UPI001AE86BA7|nr:class I SAM-dependent methyltransferase [Methanolobus bombayensis]MBP1908704.1 ubiquinone/menaquinone biosynthesis C-methylase UbiE [Methanolobus bombayensis]
MDLNYRNIDWGSVWTDQMNKHLDSGNKKECASVWEEKESAKRFWEMSLRDEQKRARDVISKLYISPESRVLDIGAGPGSLAIPISEKVKHVTAVEPSKGMIEVFEDNIAEYKCDNISLIKKRWEDIDVEKDLDGNYDVVIASFSLGMPDIRKAIEDMLAVASGRIYLYWFAGINSRDEHFMELWPRLHGTESYSKPHSDILYSVLYQMGIHPNMEVFTFERSEIYESLEEAVDKLSDNFSLENDHQRTILEEYLEENLKKENGSYIYDASTRRVRIWWDTQNN